MRKTITTVSLCVGFALMWSFSYGTMFSGAIYPSANSSNEASLLFYITHLSSIILSIGGAYILKRRIQVFKKSLLWVDAIILSFCILVLHSDIQIAIKLPFCVFLSVCTGLMTVAWLEALARSGANTNKRIIPLSFILMALFSFVFSIVDRDSLFFLLSIFPFLSTLILNTFNIRDSVSQKSEELAEMRSTLFALVIPAIAYFSLSIVSVAVNNMTLLTSDTLSSGDNFSYMIVANASAALVAALLPPKALVSDNLSKLLLLISAAVIIVFPFAAGQVQVMIRLILAASVRLMVISILAILVQLAIKKQVASFLMGFLFYALLAGSLLLGSFISRICANANWSFSSQTTVLMIICVYLILAAIAVSLSGMVVKRKKGSGTDGLTVESLLRARCSEMKEDAGLSQREESILFLLASGRSSTYIAENLCISENTVKSHTKHIYHKLSVHSKQELLDRLLDGGKR